MILCGFLLLLGVAMIIFTLVYMQKNFELLPGLAVLFGAALLVVSMAYTIKANSVPDMESPVLIIDKKGFYDRRLSTQPVPWEYLQWRFYRVKGNPSISLDIKEGFESRYIPEPGLLDKFSYVMAKLLGFPKYSVDLMSLATPAAEIVKECEKYKKRLSRRNNNQ